MKNVVVEVSLSGNLFLQESFAGTVACMGRGGNPFMIVFSVKDDIKY